jgi:hypothetical protein
VIARRLAVMLLVPSLACASFEPEIIEPVHPSLAVGDVSATSFELQPSTPSGTTTPPPTTGTAPPTTGTPTTGTPTTGTPTTTTDASGTTSTSATTAGPPAGAAPAPIDGDEATIDRVEGQPEKDKAQNARTGVFWAGVVLAAAGGAGLLGFGIAGRVTQGQIAKGYEDGDFTHSQEQNLRDRGDAMNIGAATTGAIAFLGITMLSIALGVDYVRCGKLTTKKRKDCVPRTRK